MRHLEKPFVPPLIFTRINLPCYYRYENSSKGKSEITEDIPEDTEGIDADKANDNWSNLDVKLKLKRIGGEDSCNPVGRFEDEILPKTPPINALKLPADTYLFAQVKLIFEERPLWLRTVVDFKLGDKHSTWKKKPILARVCFTFTNGPWRGCLCRLGYDPRKDYSSKQYQTIDFRDPFFRTMGYRSLEKKQQLNPEELEDSICFRIPPFQPSQLYQLVDISDRVVHHLLNTSPVNKTCSKDSGWYPKNVITRVRDLMLLKCNDMRNNAKFLNQPSAWKAQK